MTDERLVMSVAIANIVGAARRYRVFFALGLLAAVAPPAFAAAPCIEATSECVRWVTLGAGPERSLVYGTYSLDARNEDVTRALVVIHGAQRNADNYFRTAVAAAFLAGALNDTLVISPRFAANNGAACKDALAANEVNWTCQGNSWRSGGVAVGNTALTSFDFADELLRKLARKNVFPNLKLIVFSGHSAGGQFVARYELANQVHDQLAIAVTYVVANPSSYAYPDSNRPVAGKTEYSPYEDSANCTSYDRWPYGFQQRAGYSARLTEDQLKKQLVARPVTYMLGELDTLPIAGFDASCPAMAQGPNRLLRAQAYTSYIKEALGVPLTFTVIPACGHNARCMFTADRALPILFPKP
jgi:pimeloyl-ACP methyl ester carboxylesterase